MKNIPLLVIVGETASGKTELSVLLAKKFKGEIISADSVTIRRGLDIGSSKPTKTERKEVSHYLIDIIEPNEKFSVSQYKNLAEEEIKHIGNNKNLPILVGGSGLYINSILYNYKFRTVSNKYKRAYLESLDNEGLLEIARKDQLDLSDIDIKNNRRLIRHIETGGHNSRDLLTRDSTLVIGLYNSEEQRKERVQKRVIKMIQDGLEREVRTLYLKYGLNPEIFKNIGYREWVSYLEHKASIDDVVQDIVKDTIYLSKKQKTWFKRNKGIHWFNYPSETSKIVDLVTSFISEEHFN